MKLEGWIKLHRELRSKAIWNTSTPEQKTILITLLLMAQYTTNQWEWNGGQFKCNPGQFITSLDNIVKECGKGVSIQNVKTALKKFEKYEFLTNESTKTGRLITIVNWGFYQSEDKKPNKEFNKDLTKTQQSSNQDLTPIKKERRKEGNKKDINRVAFAPPTVDDVRGYCSEKGYKADAERFVDFYESKGWMVGKNKMKDWKAAVRNWCRQDAAAGKSSVVTKPKTNRFNNFPQREYDYEDLEKQLLSR